MATSSLDLEAQYEQARKGRKSVEQLRAEQEAALGLPTRRTNLQNISKSIYDVGNLLENVDRDVASRATQLGGPVTEAARRRLTATQSSPLQENLAKLQGAQSREELGVSQLESNLGQTIRDILTGYSSEDESFVGKITRQMEREAAARADELAAKQMAQQERLAKWQASRSSGPSAAELKAIYDLMAIKSGNGETTATIPDLLDVTQGTSSSFSSPVLDILKKGAKASTGANIGYTGRYAANRAKETAKNLWEKSGIGKYI